MIFKTKNKSFNLADKTLVMGILNVTPDSFSDGGKYDSVNSAVERALKIQSEGADILDIGGQSTRPGFLKISPEEEFKRLEDILLNLKGKIKIPISIDTFYPEVAEECMHLGAEIINDVSGTTNREMINVAKNHRCGLIITHNENNTNIRDFFKKKLKECLDLGLESDFLCFDPGIGFSKNQDQDAYIIRNLKNLRLESNAILVGLSRKRVIGVNCGNPPPEERIFGTIAADTLCINQGANIIRVHDVAAAVQAAKVTDRILNGTCADE